MKSVGMIGLGNMGRGMALSLLRAGFSVRGYDPSREAASRVVSEGVATTPTITALAAVVDVLIMSLPSSEVVEKVVFGPKGLLSAPHHGLLVIDTTTADPVSTRKVAQALHAHGMAFIDAPVSGGPRGAIEGSLTVVLGGNVDDIKRAEPVLAGISAKRVHVGPAGAGHTVKLLNNLLCGAHLLLAGEVARIARVAGLDPVRIFEGINAGTGRSAATEVNYPTWIFNDRFDSGFTMKVMRQDMGMVMDLLRNLEMKSVPMSETSGKLWLDSAEKVGDAEDFNRITGVIAE